MRATLFHLGVIRGLRDAGLLDQITHITAVSGGSILGAHLALHWDRYASQDETEFDRAATDILHMARFGLRERTCRRIPWRAAANMAFRNPVTRRVPWLREQLRTPFDWTGLLADQLDRLYQGKRLGALNSNRRLYLVCSNVTHSRLAAFSGEGLLLESEAHGTQTIQSGFPRISLAVAASAASLALFPAVQLDHQALGVDRDAFNPMAQRLTDGSILDHDGTRMLQVLSREGMRFDRVFISDAGLPDDPGIPAASDIPVVGSFARMFRTAVDANDVLLRNLGRLHQEAHRASGKALGDHVLRFAIDRMVHHPDAGVPDVQRQLKGVRTDLDAFTWDEITCLVGHGFHVARDVLLGAARMPAGTGLLEAARPVWERTLSEGIWPDASRLARTVEILPSWHPHRPGELKLSATLNLYEEARRPHPRPPMPLVAKPAPPKASPATPLRGESEKSSPAIPQMVDDHAASEPAAAKAAAETESQKSNGTSHAASNGHGPTNGHGTTHSNGHGNGNGSTHSNGSGNGNGATAPDLDEPAEDLEALADESLAPHLFPAARPAYRRSPRRREEVLEAAVATLAPGEVTRQAPLDETPPEVAPFAANRPTGAAPLTRSIELAEKLARSSIRRAWKPTVEDPVFWLNAAVFTTFCALLVRTLWVAWFA